MRIFAQSDHKRGDQTQHRPQRRPEEWALNFLLIHCNLSKGLFMLFAHFVKAFLFGIACCCCFRGGFGSGNDSDGSDDTTRRRPDFIPLSVPVFSFLSFDDKQTVQCGDETENDRCPTHSSSPQMPMKTRSSPTALSMLFAHAFIPPNDGDPFGTELTFASLCGSLASSSSPPSGSDLVWTDAVVMQPNYLYVGEGCNFTLERNSTTLMSTMSYNFELQSGEQQPSSGGGGDTSLTLTNGACASDKHLQGAIHIRGFNESRFVTNFSSGRFSVVISNMSLTRCPLLFTGLFPFETSIVIRGNHFHELMNPSNHSHIRGWGIATAIYFEFFVLKNLLTSSKSSCNKTSEGNGQQSRYLLFHGFSIVIEKNSGTIQSSDTNFPLENSAELPNGAFNLGLVYFNVTDTRLHLFNKSSISVINNSLTMFDHRGGYRGALNHQTDPSGAIYSELSSTSSLVFPHAVPSVFTVAVVHFKLMVLSPAASKSIAEFTFLNNTREGQDPAGPTAGAINISKCERGEESEEEKWVSASEEIYSSPVHLELESSIHIANNSLFAVAGHANVHVVRFTSGPLDVSSDFSNVTLFNSSEAAKIKINFVIDSNSALSVISNAIVDSATSGTRVSVISFDSSPWATATVSSSLIMNIQNSSRFLVDGNFVTNSRASGNSDSQSAAIISVFYFSNPAEGTTQWNTSVLSLVSFSDNYVRNSSIFWFGHVCVVYADFHGGSDRAAWNAFVELSFNSMFRVANNLFHSSHGNLAQDLFNGAVFFDFMTGQRHLLVKQYSRLFFRRNAVVEAATGNSIRKGGPEVQLWLWCVRLRVEGHVIIHDRSLFAADHNRIESVTNGTSDNRIIIRATVEISFEFGDILVFSRNQSASAVSGIRIASNTVFNIWLPQLTAAFTLVNFFIRSGYGAFKGVSRNFFSDFERRIARGGGFLHIENNMVVNVSMAPTLSANCVTLELGPNCSLHISEAKSSANSTSIGSSNNNNNNSSSSSLFDSVSLSSTQIPFSISGNRFLGHFPPDWIQMFGYLTALSSSPSSSQLRAAASSNPAVNNTIQSDLIFAFRKAIYRNQNESVLQSMIPFFHVGLVRLIVVRFGQNASLVFEGGDNHQTCLTDNEVTTTATTPQQIIMLPQSTTKSSAAFRNESSSSPPKTSSIFFRIADNSIKGIITTLAYSSLFNSIMQTSFKPAISIRQNAAIVFTNNSIDNFSLLMPRTLWSTQILRCSLIELNVMMPAAGASNNIALEGQASALIVKGNRIRNFTTNSPENESLLAIIQTTKGKSLTVRCANYSYFVISDNTIQNAMVSRQIIASLTLFVDTKSSIFADDSNMIIANNTIVGANAWSDVSAQLSIIMLDSPARVLGTATTSNYEIHFRNRSSLVIDSNLIAHSVLGLHPAAIATSVEKATVSMMMSNRSDNNATEDAATSNRFRLVVVLPTLAVAVSVFVCATPLHVLDSSSVAISNNNVFSVVASNGTFTNTAATTSDVVDTLIASYNNTNTTSHNSSSAPFLLSQIIVIIATTEFKIFTHESSQNASAVGTIATLVFNRPIGAKSAIALPLTMRNFSQFVISNNTVANMIDSAQWSVSVTDSVSETPSSGQMDVDANCLVRISNNNMTNITINSTLPLNSPSPSPFVATPPPASSLISGAAFFSLQNTSSLFSPTSAASPPRRVFVISGVVDRTQAGFLFFSDTLKTQLHHTNTSLQFTRNAISIVYAFQRLAAFSPPFESSSSSSSSVLAAGEVVKEEDRVMMTLPAVVSPPVIAFLIGGTVSRMTLSRSFVFPDDDNSGGWWDSFSLTSPSVSIASLPPPPSRNVSNAFVIDQNQFAALFVPIWITDALTTFSNGRKEPDENVPPPDPTPTVFQPPPERYDFLPPVAFTTPGPVTLDTTTASSSRGDSVNTALFLKIGSINKIKILEFCENRALLGRHVNFSSVAMFAIETLVTANDVFMNMSQNTLEAFAITNNSLGGEGGDPTKTIDGGSTESDNALSTLPPAFLSASTLRFLSVVSMEQLLRTRFEMNSNAITSRFAAATNAFLECRSGFTPPMSSSTPEVFKFVSFDPDLFASSSSSSSLAVTASAQVPSSSPPLLRLPLLPPPSGFLANGKTRLSFSFGKSSFATEARCNSYYYHNDDGNSTTSHSTPSTSDYNDGLQQQRVFSQAIGPLFLPFAGFSDLYPLETKCEADRTRTMTATNDIPKTLTVSLINDVPPKTVTTTKNLPKTKTMNTPHSSSFMTVSDTVTFSKPITPSGKVSPTIESSATLTLIPIPPPALVQPVAPELTAAITTATMAIGGAAAAVDAQTLAIIGLVDCGANGIDTDEESTRRNQPHGYRSISPFALEDSCHGVLQGNAVALCIVAVLSVASVVLVKKVVRKDLPSWKAAMSLARAPHFFILLATMLLNSFAVCGTTLLQAWRHEAGISESTSLRDAQLGGLSWFVAVLIALSYPALAFLFCSRRLQFIEYHWERKSIGGGPTMLARLAAFALPTSQLDVMYPSTNAFAAVIGAQRKLKAGWTLTALLSFFATVPIVFAERSSCVPLFSISSGLYFAFAIFIALTRPRRAIINDVTHSIVLALNGCLMAVSAGLLLSPGTVALEGASAGIGYALTFMTILRILVTIGAIVVRTLIGRGVITDARLRTGEQQAKFLLHSQPSQKKWREEKKNIGEAAVESSRGGDEPMITIASGGGEEGRGRRRKGNGRSAAADNADFDDEELLTRPMLSAEEEGEEDDNGKKNERDGDNGDDRFDDDFIDASEAAEMMRPPTAINDDDHPQQQNHNAPPSSSSPSPSHHHFHREVYRLDLERNIARRPRFHPNPFINLVLSAMKPTTTTTKSVPLSNHQQDGSVSVSPSSPSLSFSSDDFIYIAHCWDLVIEAPPHHQLTTVGGGGGDGGFGADGIIDLVMLTTNGAMVTAAAAAGQQSNRRGGAERERGGGAEDPSSPLAMLHQPLQANNEALSELSLTLSVSASEDDEDDGDAGENPAPPSSASPPTVLTTASDAVRRNKFNINGIDDDDEIIEMIATIRRQQELEAATDPLLRHQKTKTAVVDVDDDGETNNGAEGRQQRQNDSIYNNVRTFVRQVGQERQDKEFRERARKK